MLRKLFLLPPFVLFFIAFTKLMADQKDAFFYFSLWFFGGIIVAGICWPIVKKSTEENVAIMQVFLAFGVSLIIWTIVTYYDYLGMNLLSIEAAGYAIATGIGITALTMMLKGE